MYLIIVGGGKVGKKAAEEFAKDGHNVVVIEKDSELSEDLQEKLNATVINGQGSDPSVLDEAGLEEADQLVAVTGDEQVNLLACLLAKIKNKSIKTTARIKTITYSKVFKKLGINNVIYPEAAAAIQLKERLTQREAVGIDKIEEGNATLVYFVIHSRKLTRKQIRNIEWPWGAMLIGIYREGKLLIPSGKEKLNLNDEVLFIAKKESINDLRSFMES